MKTKSFFLVLASMFLELQNIQAQPETPPATKQFAGCLILIDGMRIRHPFQKPIPVTQKLAVEEEIRSFADRIKTWALREDSADPENRELVALWMQRGQRMLDTLSRTGCVTRPDVADYCVLEVPTVKPLPSKGRPISLSPPNGAEGYCTCTS